MMKAWQPQGAFIAVASMRAEVGPRRMCLVLRACNEYRSLSSLGERDRSDFVAHSCRDACREV